MQLECRDTLGLTGSYCSFCSDIQSIRIQRKALGYFRDAKGLVDSQMGGLLLFIIYIFDFYTPLPQRAQGGPFPPFKQHPHTPRACNFF